MTLHLCTDCKHNMKWPECYQCTHMTRQSSQSLIKNLWFQDSPPPKGVPDCENFEEKPPG